MPELPEVETIKRDLLETVLNKEIQSVAVLLDRVYLNPDNIAVRGVIENISRVGKYLILDIKDNSTLIIHLRMTGKLVYTASQNVVPTSNRLVGTRHATSNPVVPISNRRTEMGGDHIRVVFNFKTQDSLLFQDIRTFGLIEVLPYKTDIKNVKKIGVDALSPEFTADYLINICQKKTTPIKTLLLDQTLIAGIGNIYVQEILFDARISPVRKSNLLKKQEIKKLWKATIKILNLALKYNGTSISDFRRVDDKQGEFQNFLKVYGKKACPICGNELLKIKQSGRSTSFCGNCQV